MINLPEFNKDNANWNDSITTKRIHERINSLAPLLLNTNNKYLKDLARYLFVDYRLVMKFILDNPSSPSDIIVSSRKICYRKEKYGPVKLGEGVKLLEGTPLDQGGSNKYPYPTFKEGYCVLEFTCNGLPILDRYGWDFEVINIKIK